MRRIALLAIAAGFVVPLMASPAHAQATRTWVSGVGDDVNPCSRTAPCKTFAGAISKTAAGGEINCLDPAGFGAVTITKSIAVSCEGVTGGVLVFGTNGIVVAAGTSDVVFLKGLDIESSGMTVNQTGFTGIKVTSAAAVRIEDSVVNNFGQQAINDVRTADNTKLFIRNSVISNSGVGDVHILTYGVIQEREAPGSWTHRSGNAPEDLTKSENYATLGSQSMRLISEDPLATYLPKRPFIKAFGAPVTDLTNLTNRFGCCHDASLAVGSGSSIYANTRIATWESAEPRVMNVPNAEYIKASLDVRSPRDLLRGQAQNLLSEGGVIHFSEETVQRHDVLASVKPEYTYGQDAMKRPASNFEHFTPITPLEGSGILGIPFGSGNDYARRLETFRKSGGYIPSTPKPSK